MFIDLRTFCTICNDYLFLAVHIRQYCHVTLVYHCSSVSLFIYMRRYLFTCVNFCPRVSLLVYMHCRLRMSFSVHMSLFVYMLLLIHWLSRFPYYHIMPLHFYQSFLLLRYMTPLT